MRLRAFLLWAASAGVIVAGMLLYRGDFDTITVAAGFSEGCVVCHGKVAGLEGPHAPSAIGCAACHAGDARTLDRAIAHAGMVLIPGNLADAARTCGKSDCHAAIVPRVERSIMATMAGVIAVNREVLGEPAREGAPIPHAAQLGHGVADSHLRELCVGCHLGQPKTEWGPIGEQSQGGGCNACHLEYGKRAATELARYAATPHVQRTASPATHPSLDVNPRNLHCFGCHSRSGRIALSYEGWNEMHFPDGKAPPDAVPPRVRKLDDGRHVEQIVPDIHHQRGMECIDCHTANELMGPGTTVERKRQQLRVGCEDCHARKTHSVAADALDPESARLLALRGRPLSGTQRMGTTRDGESLVNVVIEEGGSARLLRKRTGEPLALAAPLAACTDGKGHERLSCASCHAAWAPRCVSCHTAFDPAGEGFDHAAQAWVKGTWNETAGPFEAVPPTLGVLSEQSVRGAIDTFVPGMIMTFDRNREVAKPPDVIFRRLYAKLFAHTIRRETRSCTSCHSDPVTLGYGKGILNYAISGRAGRWMFEPQAKPSAQDGLPEDAWTGFLQERGGMVSTREGARPFSVAEQRRILTVGACLACHAADSAVMKRSLVDFAGELERRSARCVLPDWP
ncbi:MAG: hypothetical protein IT521_08210 [Burkholderiales bacterium]|nr:hypothetical protein [Burkholderiales bacterium]